MTNIDPVVAEYESFSTIIVLIVVIFIIWAIKESRDSWIEGSNLRDECRKMHDQLHNVKHLDNTKSQGD